MSVTTIAPPATTTHQRLAFLDSLRGMAALYVVAFHMVLVPNPALAVPAWLSPWLMNGSSGVQLFFVISAFTLCLTLDGRQQRPHSTYNFYVRRLFRIVPLYYFWLALMLITQWNTIEHALWRIPLFALFGYNFVPGQQEGLVWASWTLGVEMVFYLFFPLLFRAVFTLKRAVVFLVFTLVLSALHTLAVKYFVVWVETYHYATRESILFQLPVFAVGMVTYFVYKGLQQHALPRPLKVAVFGLGAVLFIVLPYFWPGHSKLPIQYGMAFVYALILLGLHFFPQAFVVNRLTIFFGVISYSVYLNHPQLVFALTSVYHRLYATQQPLGLQLLACLLLTFLALTSIAFVTYQLIEKPAMELANRFMKR